MKLPHQFEDAALAVARLETRRQGVGITPADIALMALDQFIGMYLTTFPDEADTIGNARGLTAEQIDAIKAQLLLGPGEALGRL
jgi:hypothetical protein